MFHDDVTYPTIMCSRESVAVYVPIRHGGGSGTSGFLLARLAVLLGPAPASHIRVPMEASNSGTFRADGTYRSQPLCIQESPRPCTIRSDTGKAVGRAGFCCRPFCTGPSRASQVRIPMEPSSSGTSQADGTYRTQQLCVEESQESLYVLIRQHDNSATASLLGAAGTHGQHGQHGPPLTTVRSWPKLPRLQHASLARTQRVRAQEGP
jgi:hypothetical protein